MSKERSWQLPNKSITYDPDLYGESWIKLGVALELILDDNWKCTGFNTMQVCMNQYWENRYEDMIRTKNKLYCDVDTTRRLIEIAIASGMFKFDDGEVLDAALAVIKGD